MMQFFASRICVHVVHLHATWNLSHEFSLLLRLSDERLEFPLPFHTCTTSNSRNLRKIFSIHFHFQASVPQFTNYMRHLTHPCYSLYTGVLRLALAHRLYHPLAAHLRGGLEDSGAPRLPAQQQSNSQAQQGARAHREGARAARQVREDGREHVHARAHGQPAQEARTSERCAQARERAQEAEAAETAEDRPQESGRAAKEEPGGQCRSVYRSEIWGKGE